MKSGHIKNRFESIFCVNQRGKAGIMRAFLTGIFFVLAFASTSAHAWFFIYLPGSVTGKIADTFTGAKGENCVGKSVKVGDTINVPGTGQRVVRSLSGTSSRCTNSALPIRAELQESTGQEQVNTSLAKVEMGDGWEPKPLLPGMGSGGTVLYAVNRTEDTSFTLGTFRREGITDVTTFAETKSSQLGATLKERQASELKKLTINGFPAWRREVTAEVKSGIKFTWLWTMYEGLDEVVIVNVFTQSARFESQRDAFTAIAGSLTGLRSSADKVAAPPVTAAVPVKPAEQAPLEKAPELIPVASIPPPTGTQSKGNDNVQKIRDLNALFKDGIITKQEFDVKKKELLDSM